MAIQAFFPKQNGQEGINGLSGPSVRSSPLPSVLGLRDHSSQAPGQSFLAYMNPQPEAAGNTEGSPLP